MNLAWLRNKLNIPYGGNLNETPPINDELKKILDNQWGYALNDFNTQEFVVFLTIILMIFTLFSKFFNFNIDGEQFEFKPVSLPRTKHNIIIFTLTILFFIAGLFFLMNGTFAEPRYIRLYLPKNGIMDGSFHIPPLESPLTIFRGLLVLLGIYISYWNNIILKLREAT